MENTNSDSDYELGGRSRKRKRDPQTWERNRTKTKRNLGQTYTSYWTKKDVPKREIGEPCKCGCFDKLGYEKINEIFNSFWSIGDYDKQNAYIGGLVKEKAIKRPTVKGHVSRKTRTLSYNIHYSHVDYAVCRAAFLSIHGISEKRVRSVLCKRTDTGCVSDDMRGTNPSTQKISDSRVNMVVQHINSIPAVSSHYTRAKSPHRKYIDPSLNVNKLWVLYCQWLTENYKDEEPVSRSFYRNVFCSTVESAEEPTIPILPDIERVGDTAESADNVFPRRSYIPILPNTETVRDVEFDDNSVDSIEVETASTQDPLAHLDDYFLLISRVGDLLIVDCKLCQPRSVPIKGYMTDLSNLKQHIKKTHPANFTQFEEKIKAGSSCGKIQKRISSDSNIGSSTSELLSLSSPPPSKKARQQTFADSSDINATSIGITQAVVDQRIVDLFVANMLPLHIVESDTFKRLIQTLDPWKSSMSRSTLGKHIIDFHADMKQYLIRILGKVKWVATTADCWSVHKKNYLGITVHWLDPATRQRQKAVLACIMLRGHHTYDVLAQAMVKIHHEFHIEKKVTRITTDNGSNFVEIFVHFGEEPDTLPNLVGAQNVVTKRDDVAEATLLAGSMDKEEIQYVLLEDSLAKPDSVDFVVGNHINLPAHMKCAANTFNMVASKDADAALQSEVFKEPYRAAMAKARVLWKHLMCNTVVADSLFTEVGRRLVVPNTRGWKSTYDSVVVLNTILLTERSVLNRIMIQLKVNSFSNQDIILLNEYAMVMSPVARALDKIQEEKQAYLGALLPTVAATIFRLKDLKSKNLIYCSPLVDALLAGIGERFRSLLEDEDCQLATAFHPRFRLVWLNKYDKTKVAKVRKSMEGEIEQAMRQQLVAGSNNSEEEEDDFFLGVTESKESNSSHRSLKNKAQNLVKIWLETKCMDLLTDAAFLGEQVLMDLFIKFNTAIPSSAAVECLFPIEKDILTAKRSSLSDENFEMLTFMNGNIQIMNEMENKRKY